MKINNSLVLALLAIHTFSGLPLRSMETTHQVAGLEESQQSMQGWEEQLRQQQRQQQLEKGGREQLDFREMLNINIIEEAEAKAAKNKSEYRESHPSVKPFEKSFQQQVDDLVDHINDQIRQLNQQPKNSQLLNNTVDSFEQLFVLIDSRMKQLNDTTLSKISWATLSADTQEVCMEFAQFIKTATLKSDLEITLAQNQATKVASFKHWLEQQRIDQLTYDQQLSLYTILAVIETDPTTVNAYLKKIDVLKIQQQQITMKLQIGRNLSNLKNTSLQAKPMAFDTLITEYQQLLNTYTPNFFDTLSDRTWGTLSSTERVLCSEFADLIEQVNDLKINDSLSHSSKTLITKFNTWLETQKQESVVNKLPTLQKLSLYNTLRSSGQDVTTLQGLVSTDLINNHDLEFAPEELTLFAKAESKLITERKSYLKSELKKAKTAIIGEIKHLYRQYILRETVINAAFISIENAVNLINTSPIIIDALEGFKQQQNDPNAILFVNNIQLILATAPDLLTSSVEDFNKSMQTLFQPSTPKSASSETRNSAAKLVEDLRTLDKEKKLVEVQPLTEFQLAQLYDLASKRVLDSLYELYSDADQTSKNAISYQVLKADTLATEAKKNYQLFADKEKDPAKKKIAESAINSIDNNYNRVYPIFNDLMSFKTKPEINMLSDVNNYFNLIDPTQLNDALNTLAGNKQFRDQLQKAISQQIQAKVINLSFTILFFAVIVVPVVMTILNKDRVLKLVSTIKS